MSSDPLLIVEKLSIAFNRHIEIAQNPAVNQVSFQVNHQESLGIIGESGSGKSITLLAILGLLDAQPGVIQGNIHYNMNGNIINLLPDPTLFIKNSEKNLPDWQKQLDRIYHPLRGREVSIIFQNPHLAFNPFYSIGKQISEMIRLHTSTKNQKQAKQQTINWLRKVNLDEPQIRYYNNPYGLSGGMCQRAMIAMALASNPRLLIADEPTSGLDATLQKNILLLLNSLRIEKKLSMILVSHDLNVINALCDRVLVYLHGRIIEEGPREKVFSLDQKNHPYTRSLMTADLMNCSSENSIDHSEKLSGCPYANRCRVKSDFLKPKCENQFPPKTQISSGHFVRCWALNENE